MIDAQFTGPEPVKARPATEAESQARVNKTQPEREKIGAIQKDFYSIFGIPDEHSEKRNNLLADVLNRYFRASDILIRGPFEVVAQDEEGLAEIVRGVIEIDGFQYLAVTEW